MAGSRYAWDVVSAAVGLLLLWQLCGLQWKAMRHKLVLIAFVGTEIFLILLRYAYQSSLTSCIAYEYAVYSLQTCICAYFPCHTHTMYMHFSIV